MLPGIGRQPKTILSSDRKVRRTVLKSLGLIAGSILVHPQEIVVPGLNSLGIMAATALNGDGTIAFPVLRQRHAMATPALINLYAITGLSLSQPRAGHDDDRKRR
jgi:hypothetical protein